MADVSNTNNDNTTASSANEVVVEDLAETCDCKEARPEKTVVAKGVKGQVKWFNVKSRYGFVCRDDTNEDIFIHSSAIIKYNPNKVPRSVGENERLLFDVVQGDKGFEAINVTNEDGDEVEGSSYARDVNRGYFQRGRGGDRRGGYYNYSRPYRGDGNAQLRNGPSGDESFEDVDPRRRQSGRPQGRPYYVQSHRGGPMRPYHGRGDGGYKRSRGRVRDIVSYDRGGGDSVEHYVLSQGGGGGRYNRGRGDRPRQRAFRSTSRGFRGGGFWRGPRGRSGRGGGGRDQHGGGGGSVDGPHSSEGEDVP